MTQNLSSIYKYQDSGSVQILSPGQVYLSPVQIAIGMAKIAPWCLVHRVSILAKAAGQVTGGTAPPTLTAPTRKRYV
jgi:hypothetical protein